MKTCSVTQQDPQLGDYRMFVCFESSNPNEEFQKHYEDDEFEQMGKDILEWVLDGKSNE